MNESGIEMLPKLLQCLRREFAGHGRGSFYVVIDGENSQRDWIYDESINTHISSARGVISFAHAGYLFRAQAVHHRCSGAGPRHSLPRNGFRIDWVLLALAPHIRSVAYPR